MEPVGPLIPTASNDVHPNGQIPDRFNGNAQQTARQSRHLHAVEDCGWTAEGDPLPTVEGTEVPTSTPVLIAAHLLELERANLRPSTRYQRSRVLMRLAADFPDRGLLSLEGEEIATALDRRRIEPGTRATEISHLNKFYEWAEWARCVPNPMGRVTRPRVPRRLPRPMPDGDVALALDLADGRIWRAFMLATFAGFRACEIAEARFDHALPDAATPVMLIPEGKGGGASAVALHDELVSMFRHSPRSGWVFPRGDDRGGPSPAWGVSHQCNRWLHDHGIDHTLHTLRHWYGTKLLVASGGDLRTTQEGMRHASIASTVGYTWVNPDRVAAAVSEIAPPSRRPFLHAVSGRG